MTVVLNPTQGGVMIADRIRQARLAAGLTLGALGEQVGVSHTAIQKYEKGLLTPSSTQLLKLARACGIRTEYFFPHAYG
jgi:transcriptional regulator with XRE-family HTH domain